MRKWIFLAGIVIVATVAFGAAAFAFIGGDPGSGDTGATSAGVCAPDHPDCADTIVNDGGQAGDTVEPTAGVGDVAVAGMCAPDHPDCVDMLVVEGAGDAEIESEADVAQGVLERD